MNYNHVFVYGTLKYGLHNHYLLGDSKFIANAKTKERYSLYANGIPYVVKTESTSYISGEVYEIDNITLNQLDRLEGHPNWYVREEILVVLDNNNDLKVWIYFYPNKIGNLIENGIFEKI